MRRFPTIALPDATAAQTHRWAPSRHCMNRTTKSLLVVVGVLFLIGAAICVVGAGAYCYFQPRLYSAVTEFQLLSPAVDGPQLPEAFQQAQQQYPITMHQTLTARVSLRQASTPDRFQITAVATDPLTASNTANALTIFIMDGLRARSRSDKRRVDVLKKGEPPLRPSHPNVPQIMKMGVASAAICGAAGVVLLVIAFTGKNSNAATAD
jgi:hypothetical protein